MEPPLYYLVRHHGKSQEHRVTAPVHESAVRSYLKSYRSHHEELTVFSTLDPEQAEGMPVKEWLAENRCPQCGAKPDGFLGLCNCPVSLCGSNPENP